MNDAHSRPVIEAHADGAGEASPRSRVERIIAVGRLVIILGCLLALRVHPAGIGVLARIGAALLGLYFLYVIAVGTHVWLGRAPTHRWRVADQVLDGMVGLILLTLTGGTSSVFFSYLSFPVLFATLRWQWRGALGAGASTVAAFVVLGVLEIYRAAPFEAGSFIMRTLYLGAFTGLLCYIGAYEQRVRRGMRAIALWNPPSGIEDIDIAELLRTAGPIVGARRAVLAWADRGERTVHMAFWTGVAARCWDEEDSTVDGLVADSLACIDFLGRDVAAPTAPIMWIADGRLNQHRGTRAVPATLQERFAMRSVVAVRLHGPLVQGRLFLLDMPSMTSDDLLMGGLLARRVQGRLEARLTARQLAAAAAAEERVQLARDVHDGALQALTGIRLQLEAARRLLTSQPEQAQALLSDLEDVVVSEHSTLRRLVRRLRRAESSTPEPDVSLGDMLTALVIRIERQWNLRVKILTPLVDEQFETAAQRALIGEVYQILREALVNAARHSNARTATVSIRVDKRAISMIIADDGEGFPFTGRHHLNRLIRYDMGPTVLRERVAALAGTLVIESTRQGAQLEISIPLASAARPPARASSTER
jgi:signal transduction histidine kinase